MPPTIAATTFSGTTASISFSSESGRTYYLEYKNSLDAPAWIPLTATNGTGGLRTLIDTTATVPARFYRLRVQ